jgi:hypothetical protein
MKNFINLTSRIINKMHIIQIIKLPNKYEIHMNKNNINGVIIYGSGGFSTSDCIINICNLKNKKDYETITGFINEIK